jgi:hypothetical protein
VSKIRIWFLELSLDFTPPSIAKNKIKQWVSCFQKGLKIKVRVAKFMSGF